MSKSDSTVSAGRLGEIRAEVDRVLACIAAGGDHYSAMSIDENATIEEIRQAYRHAVDRLHPLKCQDVIEADGAMRWKLSQAFLRIVEAFTTLSRPARRIEYDAKLAQKPAAPLPIPPIPTGPLTGDLAAAQKALSSQKHLIGRASTANPEIRKVTDRRRAARLDLRLPVHVRYEDGHIELTESTDVSRAGIRVSLTRRPAPGETLALVLPMPDFLRTHNHSEKYYSIGAIVRHTSQSGDSYVVGAEFLASTESMSTNSSPELAGGGEFTASVEPEQNEARSRDFE